MTSRAGSFIFLVVFSALATITSQYTWHVFGWSMLPQLALILSIVSFGENFISSQGYYYYTRHEKNGPFVRNVPLWIIFLWVFIIQGSLLASLAIGFTDLQAAIASGMIACSIDFFLLEPYLSRHLELWRWTPLRRGYFYFIPSRLNRFTAPPGNYITWLLFPMIANSFLLLLMLTI
jgi:hypothetical protein